MLKKEKKLIVTFYTSDMAFATEKVCKKENIDGSLISAPRKLTADCGISFATNVENKSLIESAIAKYKIEYDRIVEIEV